MDYNNIEKLLNKNMNIIKDNTKNTYLKAMIKELESPDNNNNKLITDEKLKKLSIYSYKDYANKNNKIKK